jgi:hypothetical protein
MRFFVLIASLIVVGCGGTEEGAEIHAAETTTEARTFKAEVWGDNWFALYLGEQLIKEDSVPITTERSFNSETFTFEAVYPLQLNIVAKDFKANDTGLEYIGTRRQQMGDGGIIAQFTDVATGKVIAVTNANWKAFVTHKAPLDSGCAESSNPIAGQGPCGFESVSEPSGWKMPEFQAKGWRSATEHSAQAVRPKDGYDRIQWDQMAKIIWGGDLEKDNTVLLRYRVERP